MTSLLVDPAPFVAATDDGALADRAEFPLLAADPALVYLVAPALRFDPSFGALAHLVSRQIELYRFDINEDWRASVRVSRRAGVN